MSEQWHQHLQNLTIWEQIDRLFNPSKYSYSTYTNPIYDSLTTTLTILIFTIIRAIILLKILLKITTKEERKEKTK